MNLKKLIKVPHEAERERESETDTERVRDNPSWHTCVWQLWCGRVCLSVCVCLCVKRA